MEESGLVVLIQFKDQGKLDIIEWVCKVFDLGSALEKFNNIDFNPSLKV